MMCQVVFVGIDPVSHITEAQGDHMGGSQGQGREYSFVLI